MNDKNKKGIIVAVIFTAIAFVAYKVITGGKESYARKIIKWNGSQASIVELVAMDEGYLKAWAKALDNAEATFEFDNKQYATAGGKAVQ